MHRMQAVVDALLVIGVLGILVSLAGIAFWWVSRKMNRLS
jgi:hypothetical protein